MSLIGQIFADRYRLIRQLGSGGMAEVYLGEDILLEKHIAIKILRKELINNRESVRYFKNEAEVISHLSHPNIVEVYDVGMAEGNPYIVMEYVEGKTLKEIIREKAPLTPAFAIYVMEGVLAALIHSHKKGIIHRDIKPLNIMLNKHKGYNNKYRKNSQGDQELLNKGKGNCSFYNRQVAHNHIKGTA